MQNEYEAPRIDPDKLDFSQFHPLDHRVFSKRCREHYGGARNHMKLVWEFKWEVRSKIVRFTKCRVGIHDYAPWFRGPRDEKTGKLHYAGRMCRYCHEEMPESLPEI